MFILCVWCSRCTIHTQPIIYYTTTLTGICVCVCRPLKNKSFRYFTTHILGRPVRIEIDLKRPVTRIYILYSRHLSQKINFMINSIEFLGKSLSTISISSLHIDQTTNPLINSRCFNSNLTFAE